MFFPRPKFHYHFFLVLALPEQYLERRSTGILIKRLHKLFELHMILMLIRLNRNKLRSFKYHVPFHIEFYKELHNYVYVDHEI